MPRCPVHRPASASPSATDARTSPWPPGPRSGLAGWRLLGPMARDLPGTLAAWQQRHGDVVHLRIWPEYAVVLYDPQLVRELLLERHDALIRWERGVRAFAQIHGQSVLTTEGDVWRNRRQALSPGFAPKAVQAFSPLITATAAQSLSRWPREHAHWPIESRLAEMTMEVILRMVFSGDHDEDTSAIEKAVRITSASTHAAFYAPASLPDWLPWKRRQRRARLLLQTMIDRQVQARLAIGRDAWPPDLLSRLLTCQPDLSASSLRDVRAECMTLFLAGHETTAATLTWWAWCMAANPQAQSRAREDVRLALGPGTPSIDALQNAGYLSQTLKETMRLYPAAPMLMSRRTTRPLRLGSWTFPARTLFMIPVQAIQADARRFPDPQRFQPERFAKQAPEIPRGAYFPFGAGPRVCLGQHLAMTEMGLLAALMLQRFEFSVCEDAPPPRPVLNVTLRPAQALRLAIKRIDGG